MSRPHPAVGRAGGRLGHLRPCEATYTRAVEVMVRLAGGPGGLGGATQDGHQGGWALVLALVDQVTTGQLGGAHRGDDLLRWLLDSTPGPG